MTTTVYPSDDTYILSEDTGSNFGTASTLLMENGVTSPDIGYSLVYLKFDLSAISHIRSCKLYLYIDSYVNADPVTDTHFAVLFQRMSGTWDEETVTFATKPTTSIKSYTVCPLETVATGVWVAFDITNIAYDAAGQAFTFYFQGIEMSNYAQSVTFSSKEGAHSPYLLLDTDDPTLDPVTINVSADAYIDAENPNTNYGTADKMIVQVGDGSIYTCAYMQFDMSNIGKPIKSVTLNYYTLPTSNCSTYEVYYYFLSRFITPSDPATWETTVKYSGCNWEEFDDYHLTEFVNVGTEPLLHSVDITSYYPAFRYERYFYVGIDYANGEDTHILHLGTREEGYGAYLTIEYYDPLTIPAGTVSSVSGHAIIRASADSFVRNNDKYTTYIFGKHPALMGCNISTTDVSTIYLKFDMTGIPTYSGAMCQVMLLHLPQIPDGGTGVVTARCHVVTSGTWDEDTFSNSNNTLVFNSGWYAEKNIQVESRVVDTVLTLAWNIPDSDGTLYGVYDNQLTLIITIPTVSARQIMLGSIESGQNPWIEFYWNPNAIFYSGNTQNPVEDTYTELANPDTAHGSDTVLYAQVASQVHQKIIYMQFDLSEFTDVYFMDFFYYITAISGSTVVSVCVGDWSEDTYTWNSPALTVLYQLNYGLVDSTGWRHFNLTSVMDTYFQTIRQDYGGKFTVRITGYYLNASLSVYSKEADAAYRPYIIFTGYNPALDYYVDGSYYSDGYHGDDGNDGLTPDTPWLTLDHAADTANEGSTVHLKGDYINEPPGNRIAPASNTVTYVHWSSLVSLWTINEGTHTDVIIGCNCDNTAILQVPDYVTTTLAVQSYNPTIPCCAMAFMQFDISALDGKEIHSAYLTITAKSAGSGATRVLQRVTSMMFENSVSWNNLPFTTSQSWRDAVLPSAVDTPTPYEITAMLNDAVQQRSPTFGIAIMPHDGSPAEVDELYDREAATADYRPQLVVTYVTIS